MTAPLPLELVRKPLFWARNPDNTLKLTPATKKKIHDSPFVKSLIPKPPEDNSRFNAIAQIRDHMNTETFVRMRHAIEGLTHSQRQLTYNAMNRLISEGKAERLCTKNQHPKYRLTCPI